VLVTLDTVRADHCSVYGYERDTTPNLSKLAESSVVFEAAYAPMATTGPSHATMFTSLYPRTHGFLKNGFMLDDRLETLAELLRGANYQTAAVVGSFAVSSKFGFGQGFDLFDEDFESANGSAAVRTWEGHEYTGPFDRDGLRVTDRAIRWLVEERDTSKPFLLWAHYFDAHSPYRPAPEFREFFRDRDGESESLASTVAAYDSEIREVDAAVGELTRFLEETGMLETTLVVVVGDHGEGLMQHGHMEHGLHIYEEAVKVPMIIRWPQQNAIKKRLREPVELLDLVPTVLEISGVDDSFEQAQGRSLALAMAGSIEMDPMRHVFLERRLYRVDRVGEFAVSGEKLGLRSGNWKLILARDEGTVELFDLSLDAGETINVAIDEKATVEALTHLIAAWYEDNTPLDVRSMEVMDDTTKEGLHALGYVD
jgi:arylsulfatase A-like enzyme